MSEEYRITTQQHAEFERKRARLRAKLERKRMRLWSERDDWHKIADARSAEINRLMDKLANNKRLLRQIAMWIVYPVPHAILKENCEACRRLKIIRIAIVEEL